MPKLRAPVSRGANGSLEFRQRNGVVVVPAHR
jgi:hypothetical protein